jgi:hypothetical protein
MTKKTKEYVKKQIEKLIEDTWNVKVKLEECHVIPIEAKASKVWAYNAGDDDSPWVSMNRFVIDESDNKIRRMGFKFIENLKVVFLDLDTFEEIK